MEIGGTVRMMNWTTLGRLRRKLTFAVLSKPCLHPPGSLVPAKNLILGRGCPPLHLVYNHALHYLHLVDNPALHYLHLASQPHVS